MRPSLRPTTNLRLRLRAARTAPCSATRHGQASAAPHSRSRCHTTIPAALTATAATTPAGAFSAAAWNPRPPQHPGAYRCTLVAAAAADVTAPDIAVGAVVAALENLSCPPAVLIAATQNRNKAVARETALRNPNCPVHILDNAVADFSDFNDMSAVARNPNCSVRALEELEQCSDWYVLAGVAAHPNAPESALIFAAGDEDPELRVAAASNPNIPAALIEHLSSDIDREVRAELASNAACSNETLLHLADDYASEVRDAAKTMLRLKHYARHAP